MMKKIVIIFLLAFAALAAKAQMVAVRTDALMDAGMIFNAGIDVATSSNTSVSISLYGSGNIYGKKAVVYGMNPEFRWWFAGRPFTRWFVGAGVLAGHYDLTRLSNVTYVGNAVIPGVFFGYDFWLNKHFSIDVHGGVGALYYSHRRAENERHRGVMISPYQVGVSFIYIIK